MREDLEAAPLRQVSAPDYGEHLLVWTLRRIVAKGGVCPLVSKKFVGACGADGPEVLACVRGFLGVLNRAVRRRLKFGPPGCHGLTTDERQLLSLVAAAQTDDACRLEALLCWTARLELRGQVVAAVRLLAAAFIAHDLFVAPPVPVAGPPILASPWLVRYPRVLPAPDYDSGVRTGSP